MSCQCRAVEVFAPQLRLRQDPHTAWPKCRGPGWMTVAKFCGPTRTCDFKELIFKLC